MRSPPLNLNFTAFLGLWDFEHSVLRTGQMHNISKSPTQLHQAPPSSGWSIYEDSHFLFVLKTRSLLRLATLEHPELTPEIGVLSFADGSQLHGEVAWIFWFDDFYEVGIVDLSRSAMGSATSATDFFLNLRDFQPPVERQPPTKRCHCCCQQLDLFEIWDMSFLLQIASSRAKSGRTSSSRQQRFGVSAVEVQLAIRHPFRTAFSWASDDSSMNCSCKVCKNRFFFQFANSKSNSKRFTCNFN